MSRKKRLLMCTEFSQLATGYSTYTKNLLERLYSSDKYEIAELACYCSPNDPRRLNAPWKTYPVLPPEGNQSAHNQYTSNPINQFGEWKFEETCLDFLPDVVFDIRDFWMLQYEELSPFRRLYNWAICPTVDSIPQNEDWISTYLSADAVFTYTDWSLDVLKDEGGGLIKTQCEVPAGVELDIFTPVQSKSEHKRRFGFRDDILIIGTVNRNQKRKLYPDLFESFARLVGENPTLADRTFLYVHANYPDIGWDFPRLMKKYGISHKVLFTYLCRQCGLVFPQIYQDVRTICPKCKTQNVVMPSTQHGLDRASLAAIYNLFDVYVQYAICLAKGEEVLLERGWTPIEEVRVGDYAWTHTGKYQKVLNTFKNISKNNSVKEVSVYGDFEKLTITENHPILSLTNKEIIYKGRSRNIREKVGILQDTIKGVPTPVFHAVEELNKGDLIAYVIDDSVKDIKQIDLSNYVINKDFYDINNQTIKYKHTNHNDEGINRYLNINKEFCWFLGMFVADGSSTGGQMLRLTQCKDETENITRISNYLKTLKVNNQINIREYIDRNALDITIHSSIYQSIFSDWCSKCENKKLPEWSLYLPKEKQFKILQGLFNGDGCYSSYKKLASYSTISKELCNQIKFILRRLRIPFGCSLIKRSSHKTKDKRNRKDTYRFEIYGDIDDFDFSKAIFRKGSANIYIDNYHYIKIKDIITSNYTQDVYNIEVVNDNSYMTKIGVVKNCEGLGIGAIEAAACAVPVMEVDYSAMSDVVRKVNGYPIKVQRMFHECETGCMRALPDNSDLINKLVNFLQLPESMRAKKGFEARKGAEKYYNWDRTANRWMDYFDSVEIKPWEQTWFSPPRLFSPSNSVPTPQELTDEQFINWAIVNVWNEPSMVGSYVALKMLRDLKWSCTSQGLSTLQFNDSSLLGSKPNYTEYNREIVCKNLISLVNKKNYWEKIRYEKITQNK